MPNFSDRDFPALTAARTESHRRASSLVMKEGQLIVRNAATTINDLPEELHLCILHYLPGIDQEDFQLASLISLSKTNHHFRRLMIAKIYASYNSHFCEPYLFLRTITNNAYLGSLVKHADFTYGMWAHRGRQRYTANAQDKKIIKEGLKALGISDWKSLATQCNTDDVELDTLHTTILMQTPNIASLIIRDGQLQTIQGLTSAKWIDLIRKMNLRTPDIGRVHHFKQLHTLRVEVRDLNLTQLAPIFRIAPLRKLHLHGLTEDIDGSNRAEQVFQHIIPSRSNNLEELHLEHSFLQNDILRVVLASARSLKAFAYDLSTDHTQWDLDGGQLGPTKLLTALQPLEISLESLAFRCPYEEQCYANITNLFDGLKQFSAMKHLKCPLDSLIYTGIEQGPALSEKLPPSLMTFHATILQTTILSQRKIITAALEQLAANTAIHIPLLTEVRIEALVSRSYNWSRVVVAFSKTGIDFAAKEADSSWSPLYMATSRVNNAPSETESESSGEVSLYSN